MHRACFVWTRIPPPAGRRKPRPGDLRVWVCSPFLACQAGRPPRRVLVRLTFSLTALSCSFAPPPPGWGCPLLLLLFAFFLLFVGFFLFVVPFARPRCLLLSLVSGLGCLGPWRCVFPYPLPLVLFFVVRLRCLLISLVSGPGRPGPWRCVVPAPAPPSGFFFFASLFWSSCSSFPLSASPPLFFPGLFCAPPLFLFTLFISRCSALRVLSLLLCFPPGHWLLPCGCCPPPPFVSRGFRCCRSVLRVFFPSFCLLCCFAPACLLCARRRLLPSAAPPPLSPLVCFVGLPLLGSPRALAAFVFPAWPLAAPFWLLPPPPLFVPQGFRCCSSVLRFFFSAALLLPSCLALVGGSRRLLPPPPPLPPRCAPGALWCLVFPRCTALPSGVLRCRPAVFSAACCAVVPCLAVLWAAARCAGFVGASVFVLGCAVGCCCVLCRVSGPAIRLSCSRCGLLSGFGLRCRVLCCAVCPSVRCCAALLRVVPPGVVLLCAVLFCFACLVPLLVAPCPLALRVALVSCALRRCVLRCSPALCAQCCVFFVVACWCVLLFAAVLCAVCVLGCRAVRSLSPPLCAVLCCAALVRLR